MSPGGGGHDQAGPLACTSRFIVETFLPAATHVFAVQIAVPIWRRLLRFHASSNLGQCDVTTSLFEHVDWLESLGHDPASILFFQLTIETRALLTSQDGMHVTAL